MTNHLIWAAGLLGDLLLLTVLFMRKRATRFPWFTLFIVFYLLRSVGLAAALHFSGRPVHLFATMILDLMDILLQCAVAVCGLFAWLLYEDDGAERALLRATSGMVLLAIAVFSIVLPWLRPDISFRDASPRVAQFRLPASARGERRLSRSRAWYFLPAPKHV